MREFETVPNASVSPGMVLRIGKQKERYLRITHAFASGVYGMWVDKPEDARYARRPAWISNAELKTMAGAAGSTWGRLVLPAALSTRPTRDSERAQELAAAWDLIRPLVRDFEREANLSRTTFTALIRARAQATDTSFTTLQRTLLRYYYFGGTRLGLLPLPRGVKPGTSAYGTTHEGMRAPKRRGRQTVLAKDLGRNEFIVSEADINDMVESLKRGLRKGPTFITEAHEDYLAQAFRRQHPEIYADYLEGKRLVPVTARQFRYYINTRARLSKEIAQNLRTHERAPGRLGSVRAHGPGEIYEIDATGGRLYLVTTDEPSIPIGKPTIYLIIDRWSRFVVAAYLSLRPASFEEVRHALLVAFTSRQRRFKALGIDINDDRWPVGRMPSVLCPDRGSELVSDAMEQAVVEDLRIELTPLPPLCPDGKAIVERLIREIKRRMSSSRMKGVYADRPLDPRTKRAAREAEAVAVHSLAQAYRMLIKIIDDHNNRPHSSLRRMRMLTQAGVEPTPRQAYLWGLQSITGLRTAPLSDVDYRRMLLNVDQASMANGVLRYKGRAYRPANEAAFEVAARSTTRAKAISIRLDKTDPYEVLVTTARREWAAFHLVPGAASELGMLTLDEEEALSERNALLWARAEHDSRLERVATKAKPVRTKRSTATVKVTQQQQHRARNEETARMKRGLTGTRRAPDPAPPTARQPEWARLEEQERLVSLELVRKQRSKR